MSMTDERLREDLRAAYGRDLPGEELDRRVMAELGEEAGGESEVSLSLPRASGPRWIELLLAACIAGMLLLLAGRGRSPDPDTRLAGGLPSAETGVAVETRLTVRIDAAGRTQIGGAAVSTTELHAALAKTLIRIREAGEQVPTVLVAADESARWQAVHDVLTGLGNPESGSSRIRLAVRDPESGETRGLPVPVPSDPALRRSPEPGPEPAPEPVFIELQRSVEETTTRVMFRGDEIGRDETGLRDLRAVVAFLHPREPEGLFRGGVRLRAWAAVPHRQVVRALDDLRIEGVPKILLDVNAPAYLTVFVRLQAEDDRTILFLGEERTRYEMQEGLAALAERIRKHKADGRTPHGFLSARVYIDQTAVERVMEVFEAEGVEDVVRLS